MKRSAEETAAEVLRLDRAATPGSWRVGDSEDCPEGDGDMVYDAREFLCGPFAREEDARLIAAYRTAAPELAREVQRLRAAVAYRPGLPTPDQVRAHEAATGGAPSLWMLEGSTPWFVRLCILGNNEVCEAEGDGEDGWEPVPEHRRRWGGDWKHWRLRPCLPDGTPCPWGDL